MVELVITEKRDNPILKRKELKYTLKFENARTPSREEIKEIIAKHEGAQKELIIVESNKQLTGKHEIVGYTKIYQDKASAMLYEPDYELIRNGLKQKEAK
ncbi:ribosomal protein small subunit S24 [Thermoplasma volcanium GSS1]|uniref:Small ribosomal subunit protein eS24 n=1 Tax=Thermoplasma volcanium (strain ATCC 51530 / DSM 4299 / JCM 9571 / NBRC 15438 / GSS1) TaxID=273116 RepID=RS24_THEVO|nr:30S ribosomal protein S24e [Thermoplasma volcanium]Q97BH3.1 RecName: Full=Small ribosomal subunit protein eS24; AltName: Full=30S ribosomal protein S24e [Thermoplasma volcanium GSS1]BAB59624.1 ribosomal protein small subunit S24 [Thermoplasma volcanium GSS1]